MNRWLGVALLLFVTAQAAVHRAHAAIALPAYNIDSKAITISGVSSGAYMAIQMQLAFSSTLSGAASVAGGVYWCSKGDSVRAQTMCMGQPAGIQVAEQINEARRLSAAGEIDPVSGLAQIPFYLFASPKDFIIRSGNSDKLSEFLTAFSADPARVQYEKSVESAHGFPTMNYGSACAIGMSPWLLKCGFDGAGRILAAMYGGTFNPPGAYDPSHLLTFSQQEFGDASTPLFHEGWIYVPSDCAKGELCRLHVALHGCQMNPDYIQDQFAVHAGYNEWAETNRIIVLYPQSAKIPKDNPYACWDWFGFTGKNYVTKSGTQMAALKKMIDKVVASASRAAHH